MATIHNGHAITPGHRRGLACRAAGITAIVLAASHPPPPPPPQHPETVFQCDRPASRQRYEPARGPSLRPPATGSGTPGSLASRVTGAIQQLLTVVLQAVEQILETTPNRSTPNVF
jgi:hypothetical protein